MSRHLIADDDLALTNWLFAILNGAAGLFLLGGMGEPLGAANLVVAGISAYVARHSPEGETA